MNEAGSPQTNVLAAEVLAARDARRQMEPLTEQADGLGLAEAYRVAAEVRRRREARGERVVGRKIGFTNTTIWAEYGVDAPIWGYVYDTTLHELDADAAPFDLSALVEPRVEPEIALGIARSPEPGMDERALLGCVEWVAHGFEIVQSLFPGWRFGAADTVAAFGLHGALLLGPRTAISAGDHERWLEQLRSFAITLLQDGAVADRGRAANVLGGGPLAALRHVATVLAADPASPPIAPGEISTTGTLTKALPIAGGQTWSTQIDGLPIEGVRLRVT